MFVTQSFLFLSIVAFQRALALPNSIERYIDDTKFTQNKDGKDYKCTEHGCIVTAGDDKVYAVHGFNHTGSGMCLEKFEPENHSKYAAPLAYSGKFALLFTLGLVII